MLVKLPSGLWVNTDPDSPLQAIESQASTAFDRGGNAYYNLKCGLIASRHVPGISSQELADMDAEAYNAACDAEGDALSAERLAALTGEDYRLF